MYGYPESLSLPPRLIQGLAKFVEWSANMMEEDAKRQLKTAELQAKKSRLRMWTNYVPPATNSKAIHDQNFTGKVVEVVSGDCVIVANDSVPYGSPLAERRVNLSSIRCPKMGNPRRDEKPAPYARDAKEFLRTRLIGRQVNAKMEYSRKMTDGPIAVPVPGDARVMDFGSIFLLSHSKGDGGEASTAPSTDAGQQPGINVAELVVSRGGRFYVQKDGDQKIASIQQQLASLSLQEAPVIGAFNPKRGDIVLAQFSADNSWNRAMIVNAPRGAVESSKDKFGVFYIDYGNQEEVPLAYIKVPSLDEDCGPEAAQYFSGKTLNSSKEFRAKVEERDASAGRGKGQGTGPVLLVTLAAADSEISLNASLVQ
ncbi:EBNA2 BINDING PROTEIN P100, partial [Salix viminalis]